MGGSAIFRGWTAIVGVLCVACSASGKAVLIGPQSMEEYSTIRAVEARVLSVDGIPTPGDARVIHVAPGAHEIMVESYFCDRKGPNSSCYASPHSCGPISFVTKPGYEYHPLNQTDERGVWVRVEEMMPRQVVFGMRLHDYPSIAGCLGRPRE